MTDIPLGDAVSIDRSSPFLAGTHFQIAWDSTSLGLLKECPRKYQYQIIYGWRPKHENVHLKFGQLYHAGLEGYDHFTASIGKLDGNLTDAEHNEGIRASLRRAWSQMGEYVHPPCSACNGTGIFRNGPETVEAQLHAPEVCEHCNGTCVEPGAPAVWQPWASDDPNKNPWTLMRSLAWYSDHFRNNPMRTVLLSNGKPAVELSFLFQAWEMDGIPVFLCGHLDRIVEDPRDTSIKPHPHDRKTSKSQLDAKYFAGWSPHNQFTLYTAACSVHYNYPTWGLTVDAAQILVNDTRFARQFVPFPPQVVAEWMQEAAVHIGNARRYAEANFWPKNDTSCDKYGGCPFRRVCSKSPSMRQDWLESDYMYRPWNPLQIRGDV